MSLQLDPHQATAVEAAGHCLISAGPGSGKTSVITERAARLLSSHGSHRLAAVTFTRDAALEIKERILARSGREVAKRVAVGSFHSLCLAQIRKAGVPLGRLISEGERYGLIRRALQASEAELNLEEAVKAIDAFKSFASPPAGEDTPSIAVYRDYTRLLREESAMDFQDILILAVQHMRDKTLMPLPVRWMLVDEFQDTDEIQYEWIKLHAAAGVEITVVGDDDQSLYSWRNAMGYEGMMRFADDHQATRMVLPMNYRCAPIILHAADRLIQVNSQRVPKKLQAFRATQGQIEVVKAATRDGEVETIAARIDVERDKEWAVLSRSNRILDIIELELTRKQIPCRRVGGGSFWDRAEPAVMIGMLQSLLDGRLIGVTGVLHFAGVPQDRLERLYAQRQGDIPAALLGHANDLETNGETAPWLKTMRKMAEFWPEWAAMNGNRETNRLVSAVAIWLSSIAAPKRKHYFLWAGQALTKVPGETIGQRLVMLKRGTKDKGAEDDQSRLTIMTLHASKGLEFDNVWIMSAEEGTLPHSDSIMDEERRLMYVGMTRARQNLYISHSMEDCQPSRFIREAGL